MVKQTNHGRQRPAQKRASSPEATYKKKSPQRNVNAIDIPLINEDGTTAGVIPIRVGPSSIDEIQKSIMALARARNLDIPINEEHPFVIEAVEEYGQPLPHALRKLHAIYEAENNFCLLFGGLIAVSGKLFVESKDGKRTVVNLAQTLLVDNPDYLPENGDSNGSSDVVPAKIPLTIPDPQDDYWANKRVNEELEQDNFPSLPRINHANPMEVKVAYYQQMYVHWLESMVKAMEIIASLLQGVSVDSIVKGEDNAESAASDRFRNDGVGLDGDSPE